MSNNKSDVYIMGVPFLNKTKQAFLEEDLSSHLLNEEKAFIVTANPEIVMEAHRDDQYMKTICSANYIVPDGIGIIFAAKRQNTPLQERIAGFDLMNDLLKFANEHRLSCFFLGATTLVNEKAVKQVQKQYPNIEIAGHHHGYFAQDDHTIVNLVKQVAPDLVFVALGYPKQEFWIREHLSSFKKGTFIGVGGSFDVLAGDVKRAPDIWIKLNLEWLYRLIKQPTRIWRFFGLVKFMWLALFRRNE